MLRAAVRFARIGGARSAASAPRAGLAEGWLKLGTDLSEAGLPGARISLPKGQRKGYWGATVVSAAALCYTLKDEGDVDGARDQFDGGKAWSRRADVIVPESTGFGLVYADATPVEALRRAAEDAAISLSDGTLARVAAKAVAVVVAVPLAAASLLGVYRGGLSGRARERLSDASDEGRLGEAAEAAALGPLERLMVYFGGDSRSLPLSSHPLSGPTRILLGGTVVNANVAAIIAINAAVFAAWRVPSLHDFMARHFLCSIDAVRAGRYHTLLTSAFSHATPLHLAFNMIALHSLSGSVGSWSDTFFWEAYAGSAVLASAVHLGLGMAALALARRRGHWASLSTHQALTPALGASGAVCSLIAYTSLTYPQASFGIIFIPMVSVSGATLLTATCAFDLYGTYRMFQNDRFVGFAHGAHLGGYLAGFLLYHYVAHLRRQLIEEHKRRHRGFR